MQIIKHCYLYLWKIYCKLSAIYSLRCRPHHQNRQSMPYWIYCAVVCVSGKGRPPQERMSSTKSMPTKETRQTAIALPNVTLLNSREICRLPNPCLPRKVPFTSSPMCTTTPKVCKLGPIPTLWPHSSTKLFS
jgi:hypothetical protein